MKKALLILTSVLVLGATAGAQEAFYPGWQFQVKGGVNYTAGETAFGKLLSPAVAVGAGYQFTPWFTLRGELSGWEGKGYLPLTAEGYKFNDIQLGVDGVFDICNIFKYRWARTVNPYLFAGIGGNLRFNNKEALAISQNFPPKNYLWEKPTVCFMGRIGAGVDFRVSDAVKISLEFVDNILSDHFNSKVGGVKIGNTKVDCDFQLSALAGLKFCFGQAAKKAAADAAALAAAEAAAAKAAAEKAEAERLAAEKAAAEKAAAEKAAAEAAAKAAAEKAAAEKAAAEAAAKAAAHQKAIDDAIADPQKNIYFSIGKSYINSVESKKVKAIINTLKENPAAKITILGYADKNTGNPTINWPLSQKRTEAVKAALTKAGISEDRITTEFFGDTEQVSTVPAKNRVAVCVTE